MDLADANGDYAARVCRVEAPRREEIDRGEMREVLNGVLWICGSEQWHDLPDAILRVNLSSSLSAMARGGV